MSDFNSKSPKNNDDCDFTLSNGSIKVEIFNCVISVHSAEPNTSNIDDAVSNDIFNSLNTNNSQGGKSGENN